MGKHFDALVDIINTQIDEKEIFRSEVHTPPVKQYLTDIVRRTSLFEFPLRAEQIFPRTGKAFSEYIAYIQDYFDLSRQFGSEFLTPFKITGVEDEHSVVILHNLGDIYRVIYCGVNLMDLEPNNVALYCGEAKVNKPDNTFHFSTEINPSYFLTLAGGIRDVYDLDSEDLYVLTSKDLMQAVISYMEQVIYIMDPENFIIRKESNASIKERKRQLRSGRMDLLRRTHMRPHYICLDLEETRAFLVGESKEPFPAHPVVGHWRKLMSERYRNMKGQSIFISQYFTGEGKVIARGGWNYEVWLKKDPVTILPYSKIA